MKVKNYARIFIVCVLVISLFALPVFADDSDSVGESTDVPVESDGESEPQIIIQQVTLEDVGVSETPSATVLRVSPSDTSGLHAVVLTLIGDYNPIVTDHVYSTSGSYTSHHVEVTPDWSWLASAFIFVVVLYSFFRIIGSIFLNK